MVQTAILPTGFRAWTAPNPALKWIVLVSGVFCAALCLVFAKGPFRLALGILDLIITGAFTALVIRVGFGIEVNLPERTIFVWDVRGFDPKRTYSGTLGELSHAESVDLAGRPALRLVWKDEETHPLVVMFKSDALRNQVVELLSSAGVDQRSS